MNAETDVSIIRSPGVEHALKVYSIHEVECWRHGSLAWLEKNHNIVTTQGLNSILNIQFNGGTQITTWYVAIVEGTTGTTATAAMTYATPVYTESTSYDEATRPAFVEAASTVGVCTNSASKADFTISATKTIYGTALVGGGSAATTKADTAGGGTLFAYAEFSSGKSVVDGDILKVTITITATDV